MFSNKPKEGRSWDMDVHLGGCLHNGSLVVGRLFQRGYLFWFSCFIPSKFKYHVHVITIMRTIYIISQSLELVVDFRRRPRQRSDLRGEGMQCQRECLFWFSCFIPSRVIWNKLNRLTIRTWTSAWADAYATAHWWWVAYPSANVCFDFHFHSFLNLYALFAYIFRQ